MTASESAAFHRVPEEIANSVIHAAGAALATAGLVLMVVLASLYGSAAHVIGCSVFGATAILLYTASTLYHSVPAGRAKALLRVVDHSAIFLLIAGTYTPFALVNLRGPWGWSLLATVWTLAVVGIVLRVTCGRTSGRLSVALYVAMGWCVVVAVKPLVASVAPGGVLLLVGGGIAYTAGLVFYAWHRLPYHHAIWHVFVLVGSILHFLAVLWYVLPVGLPGSPV